MTTEPYQVMPALDDDQLHALRQSIREHGILQPIEVDGHGQILDGHHRAKIADELGIDCPQRTVIPLATDDEKRQYALTVNVARRHLTPAKRAELVAMLRSRGLSVRNIAKQTGLPKSTVSDALTQLSEAGQLKQPERITGADGKSRPATRPQPAADTDPTVCAGCHHSPTDGTCPKWGGPVCDPDVICVHCGGAMADHCPECKKCTCACTPTDGVGEQYKPDPGERIKDVGDAAPEYVQRADATPETPAGRDSDPAPGAAVATTGRPDTTPAPTWSEDEEQLRKQLQAGQTVVVSYRAHHANVVRWAEQQGLLVRVDRRSDWGNPFEMPADGDRDTVIAHYAEHYLPHKPSLLNRIESLTGKALACWCAPEPCHGDVLKEATEQ